MISIIIPAIDEAESIARSLESTGDDPGIERIVVDSGSKDETPEIAAGTGAVDATPREDIPCIWIDRFVARHGAIRRASRRPDHGSRAASI